MPEQKDYPLKVTLMMEVNSSLTRWDLAETPKLVADVGGYDLGSSSGSQVSEMSFVDFKS